MLAHTASTRVSKGASTGFGARSWGLAADVARDVLQPAVLERVAARFRPHLTGARRHVHAATEERASLEAAVALAPHVAGVGASNPDCLFDVGSAGSGRVTTTAEQQQRAQRRDGLEIAWNSDAEADSSVHCFPGVAGRGSRAGRDPRSLQRQLAGRAYAQRRGC